MAPAGGPSDVLGSALAAALALAGRGQAQTSALAFIRVAETGARPILASASDGANYWLKWPGNPHGNLSLAHELIVASVGRLLGAPVRPVRLVFVDEALTEGEYVDGVSLPSGLYAGSEVLPNVEERTVVERVGHDGNPQRFATYLALWELCLGTDLQLLYDRGNRDQVWSIDHGLWFESLESDWTEEHLDHRTAVAWPLPGDALPSGLDPDALVEAARALTTMSEEALAEAVADVPVEWDVTDAQLRTLARFIDNRRLGVARRLLSIAAKY